MHLEVLEDLKKQLIANNFPRNKTVHSIKANNSLQSIISFGIDSPTARLS